jgi:DNA (cytosine-5)-methyltransferase 1
MIPIVDLFAGPGGLGEGFSSFLDERGRQAFNIVLSIERDPIAHQTLKLRSFFRKFSTKLVPDDYYDYLRGDLTLEELYGRFPEQSSSADLEAWNAELGNYRKFSKKKIDDRIRKGLNGAKQWVLIGGPPCQAYSLAGRSRMRPVDSEKYEKDTLCARLTALALLDQISGGKKPIFGSPGLPTSSALSSSRLPSSQDVSGRRQQL